MPELPEVETTKRTLWHHLKGQMIAQVQVRTPRLRFVISPTIYHLKNQTVLALQRRGKYLIWYLPSGKILFHLGMTGFFKILPNYLPPGKHDHLDFCLQSGKIIRYNDVRRFGCCLWLNEGEESPLLTHLGVEPFSKELTVSYLQSCFAKRTVVIKVALMDARLIVGVGNIYACESLFIAGIHPQTPVYLLLPKDLEKLIMAVRRILTKASYAGGRSIRDFKQPSGQLGYFVNSLKVYGRAGKTCLLCATTIEKTIIAGRSSFFCPHCQPKLLLNESADVKNPRKNN